MSASDEALNGLVEAIEVYCKHLLEMTKCPSQRGWSERRKRKNVSACELMQVLNRELPALTKKFDSDLPAPIFVEKIIGFGVEGLNDRYIALLWEEYFLMGGSVSEIARLVHYSKRSVYRRLRVFSERVAIQIWEKNRELENPAQVVVASPLTVKQHRTGILQNTYGLSPKEAEIVLLYCRQRSHVSRRAIADRLCISLNTLKSHHRSIFRKTGVRSMREVARRAERTLRKYPEAEWYRSEENGRGCAVE